MFSKPTQRKLALYFIGMTFIHGFLLWHWRHDIAIGYPDFSSFYTAAKILQDGRGHQLYDLGLQEEVQRAVIPEGFEHRGSLLPYNHPPFEAVAFLPLARFSYLGAYAIWFSINAGLLLAFINLLRRNLPSLGKVPFCLCFLACLAFTPIFIALIQGQDSIFLLFCYSMAFLALRRQDELRGGIWLGLALCKFQLVVPFGMPFFLLRRWRVSGGFVLAASSLIIIAARFVGWKALLTYPRYVWTLEHNTKLSSLVASYRTPNLHGLISNVILESYPKIGGGIVLILSLVLLAAAVIALYSLYSLPNVDPRYLQVVFPANMIMAILLSYHIWVHDLSVLFLAVALIFEVHFDRPQLTSRARTATLTCIALLFSPLILILVHFRCLPLLALLFMVLFGTLLIWARPLERPVETC